MTGDEIRSPETGLKSERWWMREIAAQLAELNESLEAIVGCLAALVDQECPNCADELEVVELPPVEDQN